MGHRAFCERYFKGPTKWYKECRVPHQYLPQSFFVNQYRKGELRTMYVLYTLARTAGPECSRLTKWITGADATSKARKNDWKQIFERCQEIRSHWKEAQWFQ